MMTISIKDFDNQEVCIWLNAIGLGTKIGPFIQNAVDGDLLCSLGLDDLTGDLGLSGLQVCVQKYENPKFLMFVSETKTCLAIT